MSDQILTAPDAPETGVAADVDDLDLNEVELPEALHDMGEGDADDSEVATEPIDE